MVGLYSVPIKYCCHSCDISFHTWLSWSNRNSSFSFSRACMDTSIQALRHAFISVREIHLATKHTNAFLLGLSRGSWRSVQKDENKDGREQGDCAEKRSCNHADDTWGWDILWDTTSTWAWLAFEAMWCTRCMRAMSIVQFWLAQTFHDHFSRRFTGRSTRWQ